jgi:hypothetical protein
MRTHRYDDDGQYHDEQSHATFPFTNLVRLADNPPSIDWLNLSQCEHCDARRGACYRYSGTNASPTDHILGSNRSGHQRSASIQLGWTIFAK